MSAATTSKVKKEKVPEVEDNAYDEWAKKLVARPIPQFNVQQNLSGLAPIFGQQSAQDVILAHSGIDKDSAIGKFTWEVLPGEKYVPCIWRNNKEFVAVRMAEISVLSQLLNILPGELYDSAKIVSHYATTAECRLLSYMNSWHCDGFYGPEPFSSMDTVVSLKDLEIFYEFLIFAYNVLHSGGKNPDTEFKNCGFVRVNSESMIPYTVLDSDEKGVPLFYFEGQTDILREKARPLTGWPLTYLKVCCKVQGVRKDLISGPTLQIVTLADLKAYFPRRTTFTERCWPPPKPKSLLNKQSLSGVMSTPNLQVTCDKWTKLVPNETSFPNFITPAKANAPNATPVVVNNSKNGITNVTLSCNGIATNFQIPKSLQTKSPALAKIKISNQPMDKSRLISIPENPEGGAEGAYIVKLIIVEKELMHCVNAKAGKSDEYLILLQEFMKKFFSSVTIYPTAVSALRNLDVFTYLPNSSQIKALNNFGFQIQHSWEMPLIPAQEVAVAMPKLRQIFRTPRPLVPSTSAVSLLTNNRVTNGVNVNMFQMTHSRR